MVTPDEREAGRLSRVVWTAVSLLIVCGAASYRGTSSTATTASPCVASAAAPLSELEACARLRPHDVGLMIAIGERLEAEGRIREAGAMFNRARAADLLDADAQVRFAGTMLRDDPAAAREAAARALALRPNSAAVLDLLARAGALARGDR